MKRECAGESGKGLFSFLRSPLTSALYYRESQSGGWNLVLVLFILFLSLSFGLMYIFGSVGLQEEWPFPGGGVWKVVIAAFILFLPVFALFVSGPDDDDVLRLTSCGGLQMGASLWCLWFGRWLSMTLMSVPFILLQIHVNGSDGVVLGWFFVCLAAVSLLLTTCSLCLSRSLLIFKLLYVMVLFLAAYLAESVVWTQILHYEWYMGGNLHLRILTFSACQWFVTGTCFSLLLSLAFMVVYSRRFAVCGENMSRPLRKVLTGFLLVPGICFLFPLLGISPDESVVEMSFMVSFGAVLFFCLLDAPGHGFAVRMKSLETKRMEGLKLVFLPGWSYAGIFLMVISLCFLILYLGAIVCLLPPSDCMSMLYSIIRFPLWAANVLVVVMVLRRFSSQVYGLLYVLVLGVFFVLSYGEKNWFASNDVQVNSVLGVIPLVNLISYGKDPVRFCSILFFIIFVVLLYIRKSCSHCCKRPN